MQPDKESWEIIAAAQHYVKTGNRSRLNTYGLEAFKKADYQLGTRDINEGWRRVIRDLIHSIENTPEILEIKPGIFGVNLNVNALSKTIKRFWKKMR